MTVPNTGLTQDQLLSVVDKYVELLPSQYKTKQKASLTIANWGLAFVGANAVIKAIATNVFNLNVASGESLDFIGSIVGISRDYVGNYSSTIGNGNKLYDQYYKILLATKIVANHDKCSYLSITNALYSLYNGEVYIETNYQMDMTIYVPTSTSLELLQILLQKGIFLVPAGVLTQYITVQFPVFSFIDYFLVDNPSLITNIQTGFTDYANFDTEVGYYLVYDDIQG